MEQDVRQLSFKGLEVNPSKLRTTVRFTPDEYGTITRDSKIFNKSIAHLLRRSYFDRIPTTVLMTADDFKIFQRTYSGLANNCNQLTKRVHQGVVIPEKALEEFIKSNNKLFSFVSSLSGYSKD